MVWHSRAGAPTKGLELALEPQAIAINAMPVPANFLHAPNTPNRITNFGPHGQGIAPPSFDAATLPDSAGSGER